MFDIIASFRLMCAGWILMREGVISAFPAERLVGLPALGHKIAGFIAKRKSKKNNRPECMSQAMSRLGPSYVKLGQFLATRPDIVGREIAGDLSSLQDRMKTFPLQEAIHQIEGSLGRSMDDLFVRFGQPVAAASMAQVHPAWIRNTDGSIHKVAVKVVRPGLRRAFARDLASFSLIARAVERYVPSLRRLRPVSVVKNLEQIVRMEMDMRLEAAALSEMANNIINDIGFRVPCVDWEHTGRDVLTMEWIDEIKISDSDALMAAGHDLHKLAATLMQSFLCHTLRNGFFHADMHPGNLFVDKNGTIIAVDFGITGRLGKKEKRFLAEILHGFIHRDYRRVAKVHFDAGYVPRCHDVASFAQASRAIGEPIHGQSVETISMARLLALLFEVTEMFDMQTRPELLLLQKNMVIVEGIARSLDPHFNMWKVAEPIVSEWIIKNLGPTAMAKDVIESIEALADLAQKMPNLIAHFDRLTEELHKIPCASSLQICDKIVMQLTKERVWNDRSSRYALWIIACCCIVIVSRFFSDFFTYY